MRIRSSRCGLCIVIVAFVAGCSVVSSSPDRIVVEVNTYHPGLALRTATDHCAQFGRRPVLVKTDAAAPSLSNLFTATTVSTFDCVSPESLQPEPTPQ
jgi:hypothetical protein